MIEEPVQITRQLSFDYTKDSPTAFVPVMSCPKSSFLESGEVIWYGCGAGSRVIPLDHKVRGTVSLTLPESDYNRNLGIFQVRVDFLNGDGKCLFSTRHPCMLRYKSQPIRLLLTFLKLAPLITGYSSEAQTLNMKFSGYTEGTIPTSCLRVILEQRAEFTRGAGVPVIYAASLKLESEPPFLKRILWSWKWTIYIWVAVMIFVVELLFTVVCCCTPVIVPRLQPRQV
ncbi:putative Seipin family protein [Helianthus anomalus]